MLILGLLGQEENHLCSQGIFTRKSDRIDQHMWFPRRLPVIGALGPACPGGSRLHHIDNLPQLWISLDQEDAQSSKLLGAKDSLQTHIQSKSGLPFGPRSQASLQKAQGPGVKRYLAPLMRPPKFPDIPVSLEGNTKVHGTTSCEPLHPS